MPEFDAISTRAKNIKDEVLLDLDFYLEKFEKKTIEYGGVVHWAEDANDAKNIILELLKSINAKIMTKGKTLISEEIGLNEFLEENGIEPVETDLGEYIVQIAGEKPSHIIAPALHKTKENVAAIPLKQVISGQARTNGILTRGEGEILNPVLIPPPPRGRAIYPPGLL